jgi:type II secretory pathway pseudopilin PulG
MKKQQGITLIGFLFVLAIVGFFAYMAMKLVPPYSEYLGVVKAMKAVASEPDLAAKSPEEIQRDLAFKGSFQYVDDKTFSAQNIKIKNGPGGGTLQVKYDKDVPFLYNIDFLLHFDKTVTLASGATGA